MAGVTSPAPTAWSIWLGERMDRLGFRTNSDLARAAGVPDSVISRWRTTATMPSLAQLRRLRGPLESPLLELIVASGQVTSDEVALPALPPPPRTTRSTLDAIRSDDDLPPDLKQLLESQYTAMLAVAEARRSSKERVATG